ncbi:MAG: ABC transporter ATP-binding protein [Planctomycetota bacterium]|jgi:putative ABC transport system ATP-binding protein
MKDSESKSEAMMKTENLGKTYGGKVKALSDVNLEIHRGEAVAIMGASGSGKSTLLNLLGCLDTPTEGRYLFRGENVSGFDDDAISDFRNRHIGFVFQSFNLIPQFTVIENVEVPLFYFGLRKKKRRGKTLQIIEQVGLKDRSHHIPAELSGGECQRVAIARALVNDPDVLIADEPTGNLDSKIGTEIIEIIKGLNAEKGMTVVLVTHDNQIAGSMKRIVELSDGKIVSDKAS